MRYRLCAFFLLVALVVSAAGFTVYAEPSGWAKDSVASAIDSKLVPAALQGDYQNNITRQEFCQIAVRFLEQTLFPSPEFTSDIASPFHDVDDPAVSWAHRMGVVSGVGDGGFNPEAPITRQEAAVMLYNMAEDYYDSHPAGNMNFSDGNAIADWAYGKILSVSGSGVLQGTSQNQFEPGGYYTREQCYTSVSRLYDLVSHVQSAAQEKEKYEALAANANIRELQAFIAENPGSESAVQALAQIETLKNDPAPYDKIIAGGITEEAVAQFLKDYPGHSKTEALKEALTEATTVIEESIHTLVEEDKISVTIKGEAINRSVIKITNKTKFDLYVVIPYGTWFKSASASVQNMLVTYEPTFLVKAGETIEETIATACLNMHRKIPGSSNTMTLDSYGENHKITKLLKSLKPGETSYAVLQAAIWMITDNATDQELLHILVDSSGKSVLNQNAIDQAKKLLK